MKIDIDQISAFESPPSSDRAYPFHTFRTVIERLCIKSYIMQTALTQKSFVSGVAVKQCAKPSSSAVRAPVVVRASAEVCLKHNKVTF